MPHLCDKYCARFFRAAALDTLLGLWKERDSWRDHPFMYLLVYATSRLPTSSPIHQMVADTWRFGLNRLGRIRLDIPRGPEGPNVDDVELHEALADAFRTVRFEALPNGVKYRTASEGFHPTQGCAHPTENTAWYTSHCYSEHRDEKIRKVCGRDHSTSVQENDRPIFGFARTIPEQRAKKRRALLVEAEDDLMKFVAMRWCTGRAYYVMRSLSHGRLSEFK